MNTININGRLTKNPEFSTVTAAGNQIDKCVLTIADNNRIGSKTFTNFFRVTVWRGRAKFVSEHLAKGDMLNVVGVFVRHDYINPKTNAAVVDLTVAVDRLNFLSKLHNLEQHSVEGDGDMTVEEIPADEIPEDEEAFY